MRPGEALCNRDTELATARALIEPVHGGEGRLLVVEGPSGIGKTALLRTVVERARDEDMTVLTARCDEFDRDYPYTVARQLFAGLLGDASDDERAALLAGAAAAAGPVLTGEAGTGARAGTDDPSLQVLHGLFWLASNLAARGPLVLAVDDADFADPASLRWLELLGRRVTDMPLLLAVTARPVSLGHEATPLLGLIADESATVLHPPPLDEAATALLLEDAVDAEPHSDFARACHKATGGNPLLLQNLARSLTADRIAPTAANASRVEEVTPDQVVRGVRLRLSKLDDAARALAHAVAVLGPGTSWHLAAELAGLDAAEAATAADELAAADIVDTGQTLEFVHPIVRRAVYRSLPEGERSRAHARAAALLTEQGDSSDRAASHLLRTHPSGNDWVAVVLRDAARRAATEGAPDAAAAYLRRALAEPPARDQRAAIELALGAAEARAGVPSALEHLSRAVSEIEDKRAGATAALELGLARVARGWVRDAVPTLQQAVDLLRDEDPALSARVEADMVAAARLDIGTLDVARKRLDPLRACLPDIDAPSMLVLGVLALDEALRGCHADQVADLAERALAGGPPPEAHSPPLNEAAYALAIADRLDAADRFHEQSLRHAQRRGSAVGFAIASCWRSHLAFRRGAVAEAENEARNALDTSGGTGWQLGMPASVAFLLDALVEQGRLDEADRALEDHALPEVAEDSALYGLLLFSRGRLRLAQHRTRDALTDLEACGRHQSAAQIGNPAVAPWRTTAARAHALLGDATRARELAEEELELAREFGAPRAIGIALATAAALDDSASRTQLFEEAVDMLARSPDRLEHARALTDLGATLRRAGQRSAARDLLRRAVDESHGCGASALADRALVELQATGARPRRVQMTGVDALTPSERRVAEMAAEGMTNRDIAQALFVTLKTVELHLSSTYRKLEIARRAQLRDVLEPARAAR